LKGKRRVIKSIISQIKNRFNISVAEVGDHSRWQLATIGLAVVSNDKRHADEILARAVTFVDTGRFEVEVLGFETELIPV
jgi:uncharacterized protein YlxP (DUF503 family)